MAVLPLHDEARAVHRDHVEVKLAVLSKVTVHSVDRRHEPPTIVSRDCAKQNKAPVALTQVGPPNRNYL